MSQHTRFRDIAARTLDFDIPAADERRLAAHLAECAECRRFAAGLRADEELARSLARTHAPDRVRQAVVTAVVQPAMAPGIARFLPVAGAAVIALMLLAGLGLVAGLRTQPAALPVRTWTPLGGSPFSNALVSDVLGTGAQLIATGAIINGDIHGPATWLSPDGDVWTRMRDDAMYTGGQGEILASSSDTLVMLGSSWEHAPGGAPAPQAWLTHAPRSCDSCSVPPPGNPWESAGPLFSQVSGRMVAFTAMVPGGVGFVAVGGEYEFPPPGPVAPFAARAMTSSDGIAWTLSDPTAADLVGGSMVGVAAGPVGVVAIGDTGVAATAWFSSDGRSWTRLPGAISPTTASIRGVAAGPSGFVAVGDEGGHGMVWVTADGRSWRSVSSAQLADARMLSVRWLGSEYVATGEDTNGDGVAWHSADGLSWSRFDTGSIFAGASVQRAVSIRSRYVLFGTDTTDPSVQFPRNIVAVSDVPGQP